MFDEMTYENQEAKRIYRRMLKPKTTGNIASEARLRAMVQHYRNVDPQADPDYAELLQHAVKRLKPEFHHHFGDAPC